MFKYFLSIILLLICTTVFAHDKRFHNHRSYNDRYYGTAPTPHDSSIWGRKRYHHYYPESRSRRFYRFGVSPYNGLDHPYFMFQFGKEW